MAVAGSAERSCPWVAGWVADECLRAFFRVARSRSGSLLGWSRSVSAGRGLGVSFMACKRSGVRIPIAPPMSCLETSFAVVSGHSSHLGCLGLVVARWVRGELADEFAVVVGDDSQLQVAGEDQDFGAGPAASDADVVEPAVVTQGELAVGVDGVAADTEVLADADALPGRYRAGPGVPGGLGRLTADAAVRPLSAVVGGEGVQLGLQGGRGGSGVLAGEPFLQRLVQPLDLPAGLRVVGPAVAQGDAQGGELTFQSNPAAAAVKTGKDCAIEFLSGVKGLGLAGVAWRQGGPVSERLATPGVAGSPLFWCGWCGAGRGARRRCGSAGR